MMFIQRLQKSTLARQYETMDPGKIAYQSSVLVPNYLVGINFREDLIVS